MSTPQQPPVFLYLFRIRFPTGAFASFAHRISGVLLFLAMPYLAWLLNLSLQGPEGYTAAVAHLQPLCLRLASALLVWSLLHHLLAGLRFLLIDIHIGVDLPTARLTARAATLAAIVLTLLYTWWVL